MCNLPPQFPGWNNEEKQNTNKQTQKKGEGDVVLRIIKPTRVSPSTGNGKQKRQVVLLFVLRHNGGSRWSKHGNKNNKRPTPSPANTGSQHPIERSCAVQGLRLLVYCIVQGQQTQRGLNFVLLLPFTLVWESFRRLGVNMLHEIPLRREKNTTRPKTANSSECPSRMQITDHFGSRTSDAALSVLCHFTNHDLMVLMRGMQTRKRKNTWK